MMSRRRFLKRAGGSSRQRLRHADDQPTSTDRSGCRDAPTAAANALCRGSDAGIDHAWGQQHAASVAPRPKRPDQRLMRLRGCPVVGRSGSGAPCMACRDWCSEKQKQQPGQHQRSRPSTASRAQYQTDRSEAQVGERGWEARVSCPQMSRPRSGRGSENVVRIRSQTAAGDDAAAEPGFENGQHRIAIAASRNTRIVLPCADEVAP